MQHDTQKIVVFQESRSSFIELLKDGQIQFRTVQPPAGVPQDAGTVVEIIGALGSAPPAAALAWVIVEWLKGRKSRKVTVQLLDKKVVELTGYGVDEVERILKSARSTSVFDPGEQDKKEE